MILNNVKDLKVGQVVQYIGNTCDLFGKIMKVKSINEEKNQCHIVIDDHYLTKCDASNILIIKTESTLNGTLNSGGMRSYYYVDQPRYKFDISTMQRSLNLAIEDILDRYALPPDGQLGNFLGVDYRGRIQ